MKFRLFFFLGCLFVMGAMSSCRVKILRGEGKKGTVTVTPGTFTSLDVSVPSKLIVNLQPGATPTVTLNGYENILGHIKPELTGSTLKIACDVNNGWILDDNENIVITVTVPTLEGLDLSGAASAGLHGNLAGTRFKMDLSGACKVQIDTLNVTDFTTEGSGASKVEVGAGTVKMATYAISGAGKILALPLQASEVSITISGAGKAEITATEKLSASISGAGSVKYKGHPAITKDVSGAGSVDDIN